MTTKKKIRLIILCLIVVGLGVLIAQNTEVAKFKVFVWEFETSRIILFSALTLAGFLAGVLTTLSVQRQRRKKTDGNGETPGS